MSAPAATISIDEAIRIGRIPRTFPEPERLLTYAWQLTEAARNVDNHREAAERAEEEARQERLYLAHWEAKYAEAKDELLKARADTGV